MNYQWQTGSFAELDSRDLYAALRLREEVFVIEQNCIYQDLDNLDQDAAHMLCSQDGQLMAYQRCLAPGLRYAESSLGRIAVAQSARGLHLGQELVRRGIRHNLEHWPGHDIRINAQAYLRKFYSELGFAAIGDEYDEDGIVHVQMLYRASADAANQVPGSQSSGS
jgi:ElaA protein